MDRLVRDRLMDLYASGVVVGGKNKRRALTMKSKKERAKKAAITRAANKAIKDAAYHQRLERQRMRPLPAIPGMMAHHERAKKVKNPNRQTSNFIKFVKDYAKANNILYCDALHQVSGSGGIWDQHKNIMGQVQQHARPLPPIPVQTARPLPPIPVQAAGVYAGYGDMYDMYDGSGGVYAGDVYAGDVYAGVQHRRRYKARKTAKKRAPARKRAPVRRHVRHRY